MANRLLRLIVLLLCSALCGQQLAFAATAEDLPAASQAVHQQLAKRGVGHSVKLVRADGSEVKGRIVTLGDDSVALRTKGSSVPSTVRFTDVAQVKSFGLSTGAKIGLGVGIGVVVCVGVAAIVINHELSKPW